MNVFTFIIALIGMIFGFITYWIKLGVAGGSGKRRRQRPDAESNNHDLDQLSAMADSLAERIEVLESILDAEVPNWREQHEQTV